MTTARDLTLIGPRLAALIPRLATPFDGERLATVAAIDRTLKSADRDFHDLAAAIVGRPASVPPAPGADDWCADQWRHDVRQLRNSGAQLTAWETKFLNSVLGFRQLSPKQLDCLADIFRKYSRRAA
jgi:hypothetical protein